MTLRTLEDFAVGNAFDLGAITVSEAEIVEFARRFDPQPFHIDPAAAAQSVYGGVIASGWHTCALLMRLLVEGLLRATDTLGSPGVDTLRWLRPLRPGDTLRGRAVVAAVRPSESKPDRGVLTLHLEAYNQAGDLLLAMDGVNFVRRAVRPPD